MTEQWKPAAGFPNYEVSSLGRVKRITTRTSTFACRILRPSLHYRGYFHHGLCVAGKMVTVRLNRLVCATFHGAAPSCKHEAAHRDGDRKNNTADNLRWTTKLENEDNKTQHKTRRVGVAVKGAKLNDDAVVDIRCLHEHGHTVVDIAKKFKVSEGLIRHVLKGRSWTTRLALRDFYRRYFGT